MTPVEKIVAHLQTVPGDLTALVKECFGNMGDDGDIYEVMEPICVAALGPRVECTLCHNCENFPGTVCWECGAVDGVTCPTGALGTRRAGRPVQATMSSPVAGSMTLATMWMESTGRPARRACSLMASGSSAR